MDVKCEVKEKKRAGGKTSIYLENAGVIRNRMLVEICTLMATPVRFQMEMRNRRLETG